MTEVVIRIKERTRPIRTKLRAKWFNIGATKVRVASKELVIEVICA